MFDRIVQPGGSKLWIILLGILLSVILLASALWCLFFGYNRFRLELQLLGEDTVAVEYGQPFADPGCRVLLRGTVFWKDGLTLDAPVQVTGNVQADKVGKTILEYRASCYGMEASAQRTVRIVDTVCPVISLVPDDPNLEAKPVYQEAGFTAFDNYDGDITDRVRRTEEEGKITYTVVDSSGNPTYVERSIPVYVSSQPEITLLGGGSVTLTLGSAFQEPGYSAFDAQDGDLTSQVSVCWSSEPQLYSPGNYTVTYKVLDRDGNEAVASRSVAVQACPHPQVVEPTGRVIYLTFDDGPGAYTGRLLDVLKRYGVKATFFVTDTGYPELMRRIVNEGHSIGVHTLTHRYQQVYSGVNAYFEDAFAMQRVIQDATGTQTWLLRFPGGSSNTVSRHSPGIMTTLTQTVQDAGFAYFDWNVDSDDAGQARTAAQVLQNVCDGVSQNRISIVLMHDIHSYSVDAVEEIITWGRNNGYQFLPLQISSPGMHHGVHN